VGYLFEWDTKKAESNVAKHGVTFDEACTVFGDPLAILKRDPDHSADEQRYLLLGISSRHRLLVVAHAERPPRTRLISARRATPKERRTYEETA
jgi:uncharacterized DUF497 family protein